MKILAVIFMLIGFSATSQTLDDRVREIVAEELQKNNSNFMKLSVLDSLIRAAHGNEQPVETQGLIWIDTQTGNVLGRVGGTISLPGSATIHAFGVSGPVVFELSGPISTTRNEGVEPFALFGDVGDRSTGRLFPSGDYEITATHPEGILKASFQVR